MKKIILFLFAVIYSVVSNAQADIVVVNNDNKEYYIPGTTTV